MPRLGIVEGHRRGRFGRTGSTLAVLLASAAFALAAANTISDVSWIHDDQGNTVVVVSATGDMDPASYRAYTLEDPTRIVIVLTGVDAPYLPDEVPVGDARVDGLRIGYHRESAPPELHVVVDAASDRVGLLDIDHERNRLMVTVGPVPVPEPTQQPSPSPTPQPSPSPTQPPSPTPVPQPSLTPTRQPSPTPVQQPSPTPTVGQQSYPDRPPPPVLPVDRTDRPLPQSPAVAPNGVPRVFPTATPGDLDGTASHVVDLSASVRTDGSILLRVTADGDFPTGCGRFMEIDDDPPRVVVTIRGVSAPDLPRTIEIQDPNLEKIRLIHDPEVGEGELHLVLHLNDPALKVAELKQVGPHLVVRLARPDG
jgi:hypothetical protein